jgi:hypothetical protein
MGCRNLLHDRVLAIRRRRPHRARFDATSPPPQLPGWSPPPTPRCPGTLERAADTPEARHPRCLGPAGSLGPGRHGRGRSPSRAGGRLLGRSGRRATGRTRGARPRDGRGAVRLQRMDLVGRRGNDLFRGPRPTRREHRHLAPASRGRDTPARGATRRSQSPGVRTTGLRVRGDHFYFNLGDQQSDLWMAEIAGSR